MKGLAVAADAEFVDTLYHRLLLRAPDADGRRYMLEQLARGVARIDLVDSVLRSPEFETLHAAMRFAPPGHFYSPHPGAGEIAAHARFDWDPPAIPGIDLREEAQLRLLESLAAHDAKVPFKDQPGTAARYGYVNPAFGHADAIILFTMIQHLRPARIVEVGSGHSSCAMLDALDRLDRKDTRITFIEPYPALLQSLVRPGDLERHALRAEGLQSVPLDVFAALEAGDILFIDSSHVGKLASDVNHLFFEVLPVVRPGVFVHVHDIFYPFEYPVAWLQEGRAWNEAYMLRAFLAYNAAWRIELFSSFMLRRHEAWFRAHMPLPLRNTGGHIWVSRTA